MNLQSGRIPGLMGAAAFAVCALAGCIGDPGPAGGPVDMSGARALWRSREPALYAYTATYTCFCLIGPVHVLAGRDSVLTAQEASIPPGTLTDAAHKQHYAIDSLLAEVGALLDRDHDSHRVSFDKTYGFPDTVYIDFDRQMADEEYGLRITDFHPVASRTLP